MASARSAGSALLALAAIGCSPAAPPGAAVAASPRPGRVEQGPSRLPYRGAVDEGWLRARLESRRRTSMAPAFAAAVVVRGDVVAASVVGVRRVGSERAAMVDDAFHIGSVTKPITGTLVGVLVDRGVLGWETRVVDVFPELGRQMQAAYREVTVRDLMGHVSGMPYAPRGEPADEWRSVSRDLRARRHAYTRSAVADAPEAPLRTKFIYGGGSIIVAAMLEKLTGESWEALVRKHLAEPLGLASMRFGPSPAAASVDAPWEHVLEGGAVRAVASPEDYANEVHAPAGRNVFLSAPDLARFAAAWLSSGSRRVVSEALREEAELGVPGGPDHGVVWGLGNDRRACGRVFAYEGTNGQNWSLVWIAPQRDVAVVVEANLYTDALAAAGRTLVDDVLTQLDAEKSAPCPRIALGPSLTKGKRASASDVYGGDVASWGPERAVDGVIDDGSRWATSDGVSEAWLEVDLGAEVQVGRLAIFEALGPRVEEFRVTVSLDRRRWTAVHRGTRIGPRLRARFAPVRARWARLEILRATNPTIAEFALFPE